MLQLPENELRVALLIDADNIGSSFAQQMIEHSAAFGNVIVRKAYGTFSRDEKRFPWKAEVLHKFAIEPVTRFAMARGKNVSDIALVIDAMLLMHSNTVQVICVASNDSDFSLLAMKLREHGVKVCGLASREYRDVLTSSYDNFHHLKHESEGDFDEKQFEILPPLADTPSEASMSPEYKAIIQILVTAYKTCPKRNFKWANIANFGHYVKDLYSDFSYKKYHEDAVSFTDFLQKTGCFEVESDGKSSWVNLKDGIVLTGMKQDNNKNLSKGSGDESDDVAADAEDVTDEGGDSGSRILLVAYQNSPQDDDGWVKLAAVAEYIKRVDPGFSPQTYGYGKFSMLVKQTGLFVYDDRVNNNHKIKIQEKPGNNQQPGKKKAPSNNQQSGKKKPGNKNK